MIVDCDVGEIGKTSAFVCSDVKDYFYLCHVHATREGNRIIRECIRRRNSLRITAYALIAVRQRFHCARIMKEVASKKPIVSLIVEDVEAWRSSAALATGSQVKAQLSDVS